MEIEVIRPADIEKRSFEIIRGRLAEMNRTIDASYAPVVFRCIHTSADFDYADTLYFSNHVMDIAHDAIRRGESIVTDTNMGLSGINRKRLARYGGEVHCFMADPDVAKNAKEREVTRAVVSMEKAAGLGGHPIFAIGNAPTALIRVCELIREGTLRPSLVIGCPVGFVNVIASKELLMRQDVPQIVARGNKGGSNIAACICNALLYTMPD